MNGHEIVEWAPFRVASGVSEERLLAASRELQERFLTGRPGFLRRDLLRGEAGQWVDLVFWADRRSAEEAMRAAEESPICHAYFHLMAGAEEAGSGVLHFRRVAAYG